MSLDATRWAWQQQGLRPSTKLVLLSLADRASEKHECFPSIRRLEADTGLHRQTIHAAIKELESVGLLAVNRTTGSHNEYGLRGVKDRHNQYEKPHQYENTTRVKNRTTPVRKTDQNQYEKPTPNLPVTNQEPTSGKNKRRTGYPKSFSVTAEMREWAEIKHPLVDLASATEQFTDYHLANGSVFSDWSRAWRNWIANETKFGQRRVGNGRRKTSAEQSWDEYQEFLRSEGRANGDAPMLAELSIRSS